MGKNKKKARSFSQRHARKQRILKANEQVEEEETHLQDTAVALEDNDLPFHEMVRLLFLGSSTFSQHLEAQEKNSMRYAATLAVLEKSNVTLSQSSRPRAIAAALARRDKDLVTSLLGLPEEKVGVKEILKAVTLLDARRAAKCQAKKLKRLESQGCKKKVKMALIKSMIASLEMEAAPKGGVGRFVVRAVKTWIKRIPAERFAFYAAHFPKEPWKKLADICHLHPEKDFPQCTWYLRFCYGQAMPEDSVVQKSRDITEENAASLVMEADIDYSVVRQHTTSLPNEARERVATYTDSLETIIWYYEELCCPEVDLVLLKRMKSGTKLKMPYGKLMERLMTFHLKHGDSPPEFVNLLLDQAEERLLKINLQLESPVAVLGDRSCSMNVAIRTSNIIGSLLAVACHASLTFFDTDVLEPPFIPETAAQVIKLSHIVQTGGCTSPAAALWPYYEDKKIIKTFIIVTDEEENTMYQDHNFGPLFIKYYKEVYPAKLVFVSFLYSQTSQGQMVKELKSLDSTIKVLQFRFDIDRPDLTKLDSVLALLSYNADSFAKEVEEMEQELLERKTTDCLNVGGSTCRVL